MPRNSNGFHHRPCRDPRAPCRWRCVHGAYTPGTVPLTAGAHRCAAAGGRCARAAGERATARSGAGVPVRRSAPARGREARRGGVRRHVLVPRAHQAHVVTDHVASWPQRGSGCVAVLRRVCDHSAQSPQVDKLAHGRGQCERETWRQHQPCARHRKLTADSPQFVAQSRWLSSRRLLLHGNGPLHHATSITPVRSS